MSKRKQEYVVLPEKPWGCPIGNRIYTSKRAAERAAKEHRGTPTPYYRRAWLLKRRSK
jgi:hypothetical protein